MNPNDKHIWESLGFEGVPPPSGYDQDMYTESLSAEDEEHLETKPVVETSAYVKEKERVRRVILEEYERNHRLQLEEVDSGGAWNYLAPPPPPTLTMDWDTTNTIGGSTGSSAIKLPLISSGDYAFRVNWGDGNSDLITSHNQSEVTHNYSSPGTYTVTITGDLKGWKFEGSGDCKKLVKLDEWGPLQINDNRAFDGCENCLFTATDSLSFIGNDFTDTFKDCRYFNVPVDKWNMRRASGNFSGFFYNCRSFNQTLSAWDSLSRTMKNTSNMFRGCHIFNRSIDSWRPENVTDMSAMFQQARAFNQPLNTWDISKVVNLGGIFRSAFNFNQPLNNWDTSNVTTLRFAFGDAESFNQNINSWDVSNVDNFSNMFYGADSYDQPLDLWDVSASINFSCMFEQAGVFNQDLSDWDVSNCRNFSSMFYGATRFDTPLQPWDTSSATNMASMFRDATDFNKPINDWDTSSVTDMSNMFRNADHFNQSIDVWDTSSVINMSYMFADTQRYNQPLNNWDTSSVTKMNGMFMNALAFNQPLNNWNVTNVEQMNYMFNNAQVFNSSLANWSPASLTHAENMFRDAVAFNQPIGGWVLPELTHGGRMFQSATSFNQNLGSWGVPKLKYATAMFQNAVNFNGDLNAWNTNSLQDMAFTFYGATNFNRSINNWNVSNVTTMQSAFQQATSFNQPLDNWTTSSLTTAKYMFYKANAFNRSINNFDVSGVTDFSYMLAESNYNQSLNLWDVSNATTINGILNNLQHGEFMSSLENWDMPNLSTSPQILVAGGNGMSPSGWQETMEEWSEFDGFTVVASNGAGGTYTPNGDLHNTYPVYANGGGWYIYTSLGGNGHYNWWLTDSPSYVIRDTFNVGDTVTFNTTHAAAPDLPVPVSFNTNDTVYVVQPITVGSKTWGTGTYNVTDIDSSGAISFGTSTVPPSGGPALPDPYIDSTHFGNIKALNPNTSHVATIAGFVAGHDPAASPAPTIQFANGSTLDMPVQPISSGLGYYTVWVLGDTTGGGTRDGIIWAKLGGNSNYSYMPANGTGHEYDQVISDLSLGSPEFIGKTNRHQISFIKHRDNLNLVMTGSRYRANVAAAWREALVDRREWTIDGDVAI